jgi:hypothetical protein
MRKSNKEEVMKILLAESHVSPEDWREVEHECEVCCEPLTREDDIKCAECAEVYVMDMAEADASFAGEIISGEYAVNFNEYQKTMIQAYEINDPQLMFDTFADSMVGAIRLAQEGKI